MSEFTRSYPSVDRARPRVETHTLNRLTDEQLKDLRRPFAPEAIKFRPAGNLVVPYVDARVVIERLNHVVGGGWSDEYELVPGGKQIVCHLTVKGTTRSDVGTQSAIDPLKGGYSDALKRAAVKFGVGISVYSIRQVHRRDLPDNGTRDAAQGKKGFSITPAGQEALRKGYVKWLKRESTKTEFGEALGHGDELGAVGDIEADPSESADEGQTELAGVTIESQPEYFDLLTEIVQQYEALTPAQRKGFGPAKFKANLKDAGNSEDDLRKLKAAVEERASK